MNKTKFGKLLSARAAFLVLLSVNSPVSAVNVSETFHIGLSPGSVIYGKGKVSNEGRGGN